MDSDYNICNFNLSKMFIVLYLDSIGITCGQMKSMQYKKHQSCLRKYGILVNSNSSTSIFGKEESI